MLAVQLACNTASMLAVLQSPPDHFHSRRLGHSASTYDRLTAPSPVLTVVHRLRRQSLPAGQARRFAAPPVDSLQFHLLPHSSMSPTKPSTPSSLPGSRSAPCSLSPCPGRCLTTRSHPGRSSWWGRVVRHREGPRTRMNTGLSGSVGLPRAKGGDSTAEPREEPLAERYKEARRVERIRCQPGCTEYQYAIRCDCAATCRPGRDVCRVPRGRWLDLAVAR
jgi:hypothetical protein